MADSQLDISKQYALEAAGIKCLPKVLDSNSKIVWLKAIGLVRKINGQKNYALLEFDGEKSQIKRDFGVCAAILDVVEIYPYETLERRFMPRITKDAESITYLTKNGYDETMVSQLLDNKGKTYDQINSDRKKVKKMILTCAIKYGQTVLNDELKYRKYSEQQAKNNDKKQSGQTIPKTKRGRKPNSDKL